MPNWLLHDFAGVIAKPLCAIFNSSLREGFVPQMWKNADVCPIPKTNPPKTVEDDLRPISLTPVVTKHLESIIGAWILEVVQPIIDKYQFGGVKKTGTTHALIDILHHWFMGAESGQVIRILFIDYSKAFDHVDHTILVSKLKQMGLHDVLVRWVAAFLTKRQQRVKLGNIKSEWRPINGSVPQGSWLGPLLFVLMINDLHLPSLCHKYMDDTTVTEILKRFQDSKMQDLANATCQWSKENNMRLNKKKTKQMAISFKRSSDPIPELRIDGIDIEHVSTFKLLGVHISNDMSWNEHVDQITKKANKRIFYLRHLKRAGLSTEDLIMYYQTVIRPILEYASPVWHFGLTNELTKIIEQSQKRSLKIIYPELEYNQACELTKLELLSDRRLKTCKQLFDKVANDNDHKLYHLLPPRQNSKYSLRGQSQFPRPRIHTKRTMGDFITSGIYKLQK